MATLFGSAANGLGFYHVKVPVVNESRWLNLTIRVVVNVLSWEVDQNELLVHLTTIFL